MNEQQKIVFSFALQDIKNGINTLWVKRLEEEYPELYQYAIKQRNLLKSCYEDGCLNEARL